jgi:hypothetical protein
VLSSQRDIIVKGKYSNQADSLKSQDQIQRSAPDNHLFVLQRGSLAVYRFEDVIFSLFSHLTVHKRRGTTGKDVFAQNDPFNKKEATTLQKTTMDLGAQLQKQGLDTSSKVSGSNSLSLKDGFNRSSTKFGAGLGKSQKLDESFKGTQGVGVPTLEMLNPELFKEM